MKSKWYVLVAGIFLASIAVASGPNSVPPEWKKRYVRLNRIEQTGNTKAMMANLSPDFIGLDDNSKKPMTRKEWEKSFADGAAMTKWCKCRTSVSNYRTSSDTVMVDYRFDYDGVVVVKGKSRRLKFYELGTDTWKKVGAKYLMTQETVHKNVKVASGK